VVTTPRYEEVAHWKNECEEAKRENRALLARIRELEAMIRQGQKEKEKEKEAGSHNQGGAVSPTRRVELAMRGGRDGPEKKDGDAEAQ
jgi:hypothetical protein